MIRFRNPGTDYSTHINVLKALYKELSNKDSITLDDISNVLTNSNLMTAYGFAGNEAIKLSNRKNNESLNSVKMNAKMYAEVFRLLGFVTPINEGKSYPLCFTYVGILVANTDDPSVLKALYERCVLGINYPSELYRTSFYEKSRIFTLILYFINNLEGVMYKHELCLGPMSCSDENKNEIQDKIDFIKSLRGDFQKMDTKFKELCSSLKMKEAPVDNCTRLPISLLKTCDLVKPVDDSRIYNKKLKCLEITEHGKSILSSLDGYYDLRLDQFLKLDLETQNSAIRLGLYTMLDDCGYDLTSYSKEIDVDFAKCCSFTDRKKLLFSPYQTVRIDRINNAFKAKSNLVISNNKNEEKVDYKVFNHSGNLKISSKIYLSSTQNLNGANSQLSKKIDDMFLDNSSPDKVAKELCKEYEFANKDIFYPLVGNLFCLIGVDCHVSRAGDNGSRWDAIIVDKNYSIPIEIKSPGEEIHVSVKAIRQALENKIILLSRKTFQTSADTPSFVVCYKYPNERAEVSSLIHYIKATFGYKIAVFDIFTLFKLAVISLKDKRSLDITSLLNLEGFIDEIIKA